MLRQYFMLFHYHNAFVKYYLYRCLCRQKIRSYHHSPVGEKVIKMFVYYQYQMYKVNKIYFILQSCILSCVVKGIICLVSITHTQPHLSQSQEINVAATGWLSLIICSCIENVVSHRYKVVIYSICIHLVHPSDGFVCFFIFQ